ncbi:MAG TPA: hypothetical protein VF902_04930, partial [Coriobacteriia bacterium]
MHPRAHRICARAAAVLLLSLAFLGSLSNASATVLDGDRLGGEKVGVGAASREAAPDLYIPVGMLATMDGRELWARDPQARRAMASTTKIMTAVVVLERAQLDDVVTVGKPDVKAGESAMGLRPGEKVTVRELLEGML